MDYYPLINLFLLALLVITGLAIARLRALFPVVMLTSLYSLLSACLFVLFDAVDVALTEAAVGAGITTVLYLGSIALTKPKQKPVRKARAGLALAVTLATGTLLVYATLDMPHYGAADTPVQTHPLRAAYIEGTREDIGIPNAVTAILASYRGYDTLGEVTVIFTAGVGVLILLGVGRVKRTNRKGSNLAKRDKHA